MIPPTSRCCCCVGFHLKNVISVGLRYTSTDSRGLVPRLRHGSRGVAPQPGRTDGIDARPGQGLAWLRAIFETAVGVGGCGGNGGVFCQLAREVRCVCTYEYSQRLVSCEFVLAYLFPLVMIECGCGLLCFFYADRCYLVFRLTGIYRQMIYVSLSRARNEKAQS